MLSSIRGFAMLLMLVSIASACATPESTATPEVPNKILFVGASNIYLNSGHSYHFEKLAASADSSLAIEADDLTQDNSPLRALWEGSATLDPGLDGAPTRQVQEVIGSGDYDTVVLSAQILVNEIARPGFDLDTQRQYADKFVKAAKDVGSYTTLYMLWPLNPDFGLTQPVATVKEVAQWVGDMGEELDVPVAPAALAWQRAMKERPDLVLYSDMRHPTVHGTYLGVCVVYATVLGKSPEGLSYWPEDDGVSEGDAAFLQRIAWETVEEYQAQQ